MDCELRAAPGRKRDGGNARALTESVFADGHHGGNVSGVSMTLYLWKAPVIDDPDEAVRLIDEYDERRDDSAFEPSADIRKVAEELLRRFPDEGDGQWADGPPEATDRLLSRLRGWDRLPRAYSRSAGGSKCRCSSGS